MLAQPYTSFSTLLFPHLQGIMLGPHNKYNNYLLHYLHTRTHARTHAHSPSSHTSYPPARGLLLTSRESCSFSSAVSQETTRQATTCPTLKHTLGSASTGMLTDTAECSIRDNAIQHSYSMVPYCTLSLYRLCIEGTTSTVCV